MREKNSCSLLSMIAALLACDCAQSNFNSCAGGSPSISFDFWIDDIYLVNRQAGG
jgi:hypothetical protein